MPDIDYLVLADYVRQDAGTTHIMAAGLDTFTVPAEQLPVAIPVGIVVRLVFSSQDTVGEEHELSLTFDGPDGNLLTASNRFPVPPQQPGVPEHWRTAVNVLFRIFLPLPGHGDHYRLAATLDDNPLMSRGVDVRVIEPVAQG
jgi:hypothetical protein